MGNVCISNKCAKCGAQCKDNMSCRVHRELEGSVTCEDCNVTPENYHRNCYHRVYIPTGSKLYSKSFISKERRIQINSIKFDSILSNITENTKLLNSYHNTHQNIGTDTYQNSAPNIGNNIKYFINQSKNHNKSI